MMLLVGWWAAVPQLSMEFMVQLNETKQDMKGKGGCVSDPF